MAEKKDFTTDKNNSGEYVYGGGTDEKGNTIQTETSSVLGILQDITKVTKEDGSVDVYVDKTWDN